MKEPKSMREIHEIRDKLYEENKLLSWQERMEKTNRTAEEMIRRYGLKIKIHRADKAA